MISTSSRQLNYFIFNDINRSSYLPDNSSPSDKPYGMYANMTMVRHSSEG